MPQIPAAELSPPDAIARLKANQMTEKAIGEAVGVSQSAINKIATGKVETSWKVGSALVQLAEAMPDPVDQAKAA